MFLLSFFFSQKRFSSFPNILFCHGLKRFCNIFFLVLRTRFTRSIPLHSCLSQNVKLFNVKSMTSWRYHFPMLSNSCRTYLHRNMQITGGISLSYCDTQWCYDSYYACHSSYSSNSISLCDCYVCQQLSKCFGVILDFRSADELPWIVQ